MKKSLKIIVSLLLLGIVLELFSNYLYTTKLNSFRYDKSLNELVEYTIYPLNISLAQLGMGEVMYPYVSTSPNTKKYLLTTLLEKKNLFTNRYDNLFFARKRIAELDQWGNETNWDVAIAKYRNLIHKAITDNVLSKDTNVNKTYQKNIILHQLISDTSKLEYFLNKSSKSAAEISRLKLLVKATYTELATELFEYLPRTEDTPLEYPLLPVNKEQQAGIYKAFIENIEVLPSNTSAVKMIYGETLISSQSASSLTLDKNTSTFTFDQINLNNKIKSIDLFIPQFNIPITTKWNSVQTKTGSRYELTLPTYKQYKNYRITVVPKNKNELKITVDQAYKDRAYTDEKIALKPKLPVYLNNTFIMNVYNTISQYFEGDSIPVIKGDTLYQQTVTEASSSAIVAFTNRRAYVANRLIIESPQKLDKNELPEISMQLVQQPKLILQKNSYDLDKETVVTIDNLSHKQARISVQNSTLTQDYLIQLINKYNLSLITLDQANQSGYRFVIQHTLSNYLQITAKIVFSIAFILTALFLFLKLNTKNNLKIKAFFTRLELRIKKYTRRLDTTVSRLKSIFLFSSIFFIVIQTLGIVPYDEYIVSLTIFMWLTAVIKYRVNPQLHFHLSLIYMCLTIFFFVIRKNPVEVERMFVANLAVWSILFLIMGVFHEWYKTKYAVLSLIEANDFLPFLIKNMRIDQARRRIVLQIITGIIPSQQLSARKKIVILLSLLLLFLIFCIMIGWVVYRL